ncbi:hypothetical protein ES288_D02G289700v1 [Gossypium darwinii]|uniref:Uncharacterized protein n=2 Tax=Gossypium TaxID=3633 RepID=A0A5D2M383_GOSTO|nr:hypothetical protein ES288_D02G289700v1 [Gossypium darwinii]TYH85778.1 hypothetical protein ES332_D02G292700v1 [Gossypium tomentosum]
MIYYKFEIQKSNFESRIHSFNLQVKKSIFMAKIPPSNKFSQAKQKKLCNLNLKRRILPQFPSFPERREKETKNCFIFMFIRC